MGLGDIANGLQNSAESKKYEIYMMISLSVVTMFYFLP